MKDLPLMEAPADRYPGEMGGLIDVLATYKNTANSLGYSVYYYAQNMYNLPDLKLLQVDGIAPTNETISDKSYPFINDFMLSSAKMSPKTAKPANFSTGFCLMQANRPSETLAMCPLDSIDYRRLFPPT